VRRGRAILFILLAGLACGRRSGPATPLTDALLAQGGDPGDPDGVASRDTLGQAAAQIERVWSARPRARAEEVFAEVVFGKLGFVREVSDQSLAFQRLSEVLARRRGSCYGLAAVYLALAERLGPRHGFTMAGVMVPGHLFVQVRDGEGARNVELLHQGKVEPESWYREKYRPAPGAPAYLRPLSSAELLAVLDYNSGNDLRRHGRLADAAAAYRRAANAFPGFAEAQASLGLVLQLQGDLTGAQAAYDRARAANPQLPGLDRNLELLRQEQLSGKPAPPSSPPGTPGSP
jgi:regulator of sirC expression with transglutaminase-like and TPR domain